jgi:transcription termination factor NusB
MATERREHRLALEILYAVDIGKTTLEDALRQAREQVGVFSRGDQARLEDPYEPEYPAVERRSGAPRPTDWALVESIVRGTLERRGELEAEIAPLLQHWKFERLAGVVRVQGTQRVVESIDIQHRAEAAAPRIQGGGT